MQTHDTPTATLPNPLPDVIELGGRRFRVIGEATTARHDHWLMGRVIDAGLAHTAIQPGESPTSFVETTLDRVIAGGHAFLLLAGLLIPDGLAMTAWTPDVATEIATHLEQLTAPSDKASLRGILAVTLAGFFQSGLASLTTSRTASVEQVVPASPNGTPASVPIGGA